MPPDDGTGATPGAGAGGATQGGTTGQQGDQGNQRDAGAQGQGSQGTTTGQGTGSDQGQGDAGDQGDLGTGGRNALQREREARKTAETEAKTLRDRLKALEDKDLPEAEKVKRDHDDLKAQQAGWDVEKRALHLQVAVTSKAVTMGFRDPADAVHLVSESDIERDADGRPTNIEEVLKKLAKDKPYLVTNAQAGGGADQGARGSRGGTGDDMNRRIRQAAGRG